MPVKHKQMQLASQLDLLGRGLMITVSYNAYCAITKEGDNDIWTVRPQGVVPLLPLCSQIDAGATVNALLGDTFSRENNTHGSRFHDRDPQFASRILGAMTQSCYIGTRDIRSRVIRGLYCMCGQQHSFSTHQRIFLWKCRSFWDRKCLNLRGTWTPTFRFMPNAPTIWAIRPRHLLSHDSSNEGN